MAVAIVQCSNNMIQILDCSLSGKDCCIIFPIFIWDESMLTKHNQQISRFPFTSVHTSQCRPGAFLGSGKGEESKGTIVWPGKTFSRRLWDISLGLRDRKSFIAEASVSKDTETFSQTHGLKCQKTKPSLIVMGLSFLPSPIFAFNLKCVT